MNFILSNRNNLGASVIVAIGSSNRTETNFIHITTISEKLVLFVIGVIWKSTEKENDRLALGNKDARIL